jgi:hypothetical protein
VARSIPGLGHIEKRKLGRLKKEKNEHGKDVQVFFLTPPPRKWALRSIDRFDSEGECQLDADGLEYIDLRFDLPTESRVEHFMGQYFKCPHCNSLPSSSSRLSVQCKVCSYKSELDFDLLARHGGVRGGVRGNWKCPKCKHEEPLADTEFTRFREKILMCKSDHDMGKTFGEYLDCLSLKKTMALFRTDFTEGIISFGWKVSESNVVCPVTQEQPLSNYLRQQKEKLRSIIQGQTKVFPQFVDFEEEWNSRVIRLHSTTIDAGILRDMVRRRARDEMKKINQITSEQKRGAAINMLRQKDGWGVVDERLR